MEREDVEQPGQVVNQESSAGAEGERGESVNGDEIAAVRELILRAHQDVVPELIQGSSVAELMASVEPARAAYQAVAQRVQERQGSGESRGSEGAPAEPPKVPAGGGVAVVDLDALPTAEKIKRGIAAARRG